jgi:hypothetical protein
MKAWMTTGALSLLLAGCYTYRPSAEMGQAPVPGAKVEVELTTTASNALANQVGPDVRVLLGQIVEADSSHLVLAVSQSETTRHGIAHWNGEQVTLAPDQIASVRERKLSVGGTALLGGLASGGLVALFAVIGGSGSLSGAAPGGAGSGTQ